MKDAIFMYRETGEEISAYKEYYKWFKAVWSEQAQPGERFNYPKKVVLEEAIKFYSTDVDYELVRII